MPKKLQELIEEYDKYKEKNGVIELPLDYEWAAEMTINTFKRNYLPHIKRAIFLIVVLILTLFLIRRKWRKTKN